MMDLISSSAGVLPTVVDGGIENVAAGLAGTRNMEQPWPPLVDTAHPVCLLAVLIESRPERLADGLIGERPIFSACETCSTIACLSWDRTIEITATNSHRFRSRHCSCRVMGGIQDVFDLTKLCNAEPFD